MNSFYNTALFDKKVSLFNLYAVRVGLDNAATSRILVNPSVILILQTTVNLNFYLFCVILFLMMLLSCKSISLFKCLFHSWPESQSVSLP